MGRVWFSHGRIQNNQPTWPSFPLWAGSEGHLSRQDFSFPHEPGWVWQRFRRCLSSGSVFLHVFYLWMYCQLPAWPVFVRQRTWETWGHIWGSSFLPTARPFFFREVESSPKAQEAFVGSAMPQNSWIFVALYFLTYLRCHFCLLSSGLEFD